VISLREDHEHLAEMKAEVQHLRGLEQTHKLSVDRITELELIVTQLTADLDQEKRNKESALGEKEQIQRESELVREVLASITLIHSFILFFKKTDKRSLKNI